MKDHLIIDGNAVYEIDDDCESQIKVTEVVKKDNDIMLLLILILLL